jgi:integrating conjugative element protein (TIGR03756 family)
MRAAGVVLASLLAMATPAESLAEALTTPVIVARTTSAALSCMRWTPIGMCFWLRCTISGCHVRSSLKVGHYNPDLVVSAFNTVGGNPWREARATLGAAQRLAARTLLGRMLSFPIGSAGNRTEGDPARRDHRNLVFRDSDAIGNPVSTFTRLSYSLVCRSEATPLEPYFQSSLDALAWRSAAPESLYPASLIPGRKEVGDWPLQSWGSVYPRNGWVTQAEEPKAAAVIAQRAGDIVTRTAQPHVYLSLRPPKPRRQRVWPPGPLLENDARSGTWQMLSPRTEASCAAFGKNDVGLLSSWSSGRVDPHGEYSWNLWRPYKCCRVRGQVFLYSIDWSEYPP